MRNTQKHPEIELDLNVEVRIGTCTASPLALLGVVALRCTLNISYSDTCSALLTWIMFFSFNFYDIVGKA
jgi:hypothetical protein